MIPLKPSGIKKKILSFALIILFVFLNMNKSIAQKIEYLELCYNADSLLRINENHKAFELYHAAFGKYKGRLDPNDLYNASCAAARIGDIKVALSYLWQLLKETNFHSKKELIEDQDLIPVRQSKEWPEIISLAERKDSTAKSRVNANLQNKLEKLIDEDQLYRKRRELVLQENGDKNKINVIEDSMAITDKRHVKFMRDLIHKYGWLSRDEVGDNGATAIWAIVQHADDDIEFQKTSLELLKKVCASGKVSRTEVALLTDRILISEKKQQLYGTQLKRSKSNGKWYPIDLFDPPNVDKRRAEMDLFAIQHYLYSVNKTTIK